MAAMEGESFEHYVPDMRAIVESKTADPDPFIKGMAAMLRPAAGVGCARRAARLGAARQRAG